MKVKIDFTKNGTFFLSKSFYYFWPNSFIKMLWNYQFYWKKLSMDISMMLWQHFIHIWNTFMKEWLLKVCPSTNCNQFTRRLTTSRNSQKNGFKPCSKSQKCCCSSSRDLFSNVYQTIHQNNQNCTSDF